MTNESAVGEVELLPCHRCGEKPELYTEVEKVKVQGCRNLKNLNFYRYYCVACTVADSVNSSKKAAAKAWNTRANDAELERLKRLEENVKNKINEHKRIYEALKIHEPKRFELIQEELEHIKILESLEK